jgi:hypothetical protein
MITLRWSSLVACSIALVVLSACSTEILKTPVRIPVYDGPLKSIDEVGIFRPNQLVSIGTVDGINVGKYKRVEVPFGMGGWEIEILPGPHVFEFNYSLNIPNRTVHSTAPYVKPFTVEAGHIYVAQAAYGPRNQWSVDIVDVTESHRAWLVERREAVARN